MPVRNVGKNSIKNAEKAIEEKENTVLANVLSLIRMDIIKTEELSGLSVWSIFQPASVVEKFLQRNTIENFAHTNVLRDLL